MSGRHAFPARFTDAPSIQPERVPAHRAPKHRAKRPVDSCRHFRSGSQPLSCIPCRIEPLPSGKHRAEAAA